MTAGEERMTSYADGAATSETHTLETDGRIATYDTLSIQQSYKRMSSCTNPLRSQLIHVLTRRRDAEAGLAAPVGPE